MCRSSELGLVNRGSVISKIRSWKQGLPVQVNLEICNESTRMYVHHFQRKPTSIHSIPIFEYSNWFIGRAGPITWVLSRECEDLRQRRDHQFSLPSSFSSQHATGHNINVWPMWWKWHILQTISYVRTNCKSRGYVAPVIWDEDEKECWKLSFDIRPYILQFHITDRLSTHVPYT